MTTTLTELTPEAIAAVAAEMASDRKALDIVQLDLREMIGYADYFVICTGRTDRQTRAIHDAIHHASRASTGCSRARPRASGRHVDPAGLPRCRGAHLHARDA